MIQVKRGTKPEGLNKEAARWLDEQQTQPITAAQFWSKVSKRQAMQSYARQLHQAFQYKCAFCESKPAATNALQVEHYRPKGNPQFERLMFDWDNWLTSCGCCNSKKWRHFPDCEGEPCLIDPCADDPKKHIEFLMENVLGKTQRGEETIKLIGLERSPLKEERAKWLLQINSLLLLCLTSARSTARQLLIWAMQPDAPYSAMTYCYLSEKTPKLANPEIPHPHVKFDAPTKRIAELIENNDEFLMRLA
ncbi:MAG: hypothetical protein DRR08_33525 [Candidatus Parabeggiatoa sp. nov. 2]|nr:MAG: hypothetical protein B6247_10490 [Beggiatoa sp. 4572_84]RKZ46166.1 MAG: hypothetical protein DRR08_33525 [Gammaproteobacteria bacterium]